jgi:hypothetical protein
MTEEARMDALARELVWRRWRMPVLLQLGLREEGRVYNWTEGRAPFSSPRSRPLHSSLVRLFRENPCMCWHCKKPIRLWQKKVHTAHLQTGTVLVHAACRHTASR